MALGTYVFPRDVDAGASDRQLTLARLKADELRRAFEYMINQEARRVERRAGITW